MGQLSSDPSSHVWYSPEKIFSWVWGKETQIPQKSKHWTQVQALLQNWTIVFKPILTRGILSRKDFFPGFQAKQQESCKGQSTEHKFGHFLQTHPCTWNTHPTYRYSPAEMLNSCRILQQINKHTSCCVWTQFMLFHSRPTWWRCVGPRGIQIVQICTF